MKNDESSQKEKAVQTHSIQAGEFAASYSNIKAEAYSNCFNYSRRRLDLWLNRFIPAAGNGARLIDIGCGTGHHLAALRERGFAVTGVDGSDEMLERARANNPGTDLVRADVESIPLPNACFDHVLSIEVLRYLPTPDLCVKEMARLLKPGGSCVVTAMPLLNLNGYWLVNRLANLMPVGDLVRLKQFFTTSARLRATFEDAGFEKIEIHGVYVGPVNWVERLTPRLLPGLLRAWEPLDAGLADRPLIRELSNMFVVRAIKR